MIQHGSHIDQLKSAAQALAGQPKRFFELATILGKLNTLDQAAFNAVISGHGLKRRKAYQLVRIAHNFYGSWVPVERLEAIGSTKLHILCEHQIGSHTPKPDLEKYLADAESLSAQKLKFKMETYLTLDSVRVVKLYFDPDSYEIYRELMLQNGAKPRGKGLVGQEDALLKVLKNAQSKLEQAG